MKLESGRMSCKKFVSSVFWSDSCDSLVESHEEAELHISFFHHLFLFRVAGVYGHG